LRNRAGIILIEDGKLALIERHRQGRHYFSFPGGGVDEGETDEQAAIREAEEELGIRVEIIHKAAEVLRENKRKQVYFLVRHVDGKFGTGTGEEYGKFDPVFGTYNPIWMPIENVLTENVVPKKLARLVADAYHQGWKKEPIILIEES
jgi:8-oxo-dGTP pyrophosphatase MutT (NUDIX family)